MWGGRRHKEVAMAPLKYRVDLRTVWVLSPPAQGFSAALMGPVEEFNRVPFDES